MKKQLIILGIILLFVCVGLSGCDEQKDDGGGYSKLELVSHSVVTQATNFSYVTNEPDQDFRWDDIADGFSADKLPRLVNGSEGGYKGARYLIRGTIKNVAGKILTTFQMDAKFYDVNNNYLGTKTQYISNLANNSTRDFRITYNNWDYPLGSYFANVTRMEFELTDVSPPSSVMGLPDFKLSNVTVQDNCGHPESGYGNVWVNYTLRNDGDVGWMNAWARVYQIGYYAHCGNIFNQSQKQEIYLKNAEVKVVSFVFIGVDQRTDCGCYGALYWVEPIP